MNQTTAAPLVSILLPAFNAAATLPAALRSIRRQTERRWECVLIDDGSTDDTLAIARRSAAGDPRLRVLAQPHRGLVAALNTGLQQCHGGLVARMDADDVMHRDRLDAQLTALRGDPSLAAVGTHVRLFPRRALGPGLRAYERWLNAMHTAAQVRADAFVECPIAHPTLMIRRDLLARYGYRECGWPEDYDLVLRLLAAGHGVGVVPRRLLLWRHHALRLSRTSPRYAIGRFTACKAAFLAADFLAQSDTYTLWGYGATGRALRRALLAHGKRVAHFVEVHPGRLGQVIDGAPVIAPDALAELPRRPAVVSVAGSAPRNRIRAFLAQLGWREIDDFVCAA